MIDKMLAQGTWVLVADGQKALLMENVGTAEQPNLEVFRKEVDDNPATREQGADRPGRFNRGPDVHRSAVADSDWHQLEKDRFARDLARLLYDHAHAGRFERLVLAAAPSVLGELRRNLHKEVQSRIVGEIDKDLTHHRVDQIEQALKHAA